MQRVYSNPAPAEVYMVQDYLEQAGIRAVVQGGELGGLQGLIPTNETYASVWVADDVFAQAEMLVQEFLRSQSLETTGSSWRCPDCGEEIEPQFTDCWNCGAARIS